MTRGDQLRSGQRLTSANGRFALVMQSDGDLAIVDRSGTARWHSATAATGAKLQLRADGYLVVTSSKGVLWRSDKPADVIKVLDSGDVVGLRRDARDWYIGPAHVQKPVHARRTGVYTPPAPTTSSAPSTSPTSSSVPSRPTNPSAPTTSPPRSTWTSPTTSPTTSPSPAPTSLPTGRAFTLHMLRRASFGVTPALEADVSQAGGISRWLEQQLAPATITDPVADAVIKRFPLAFIDPPTARARPSNGSWDGMFDLVKATLARQIWSKRQLFEVMVDFWSNHLNITTPSSEPWDSKMWDDAHVIRANALGRFDDMLVASTQSPAMLQYLSNADSRGTAPNENYGRELLELHTVGVDAGYAHADVIDAARTLSGFTTWTEWNGGTVANYGSFHYRADWHYVGPVKVLGWTHPNANAGAGLAAGESLARYLANHPATARHLATKLAIRFVSDNPPAALINRLTAVYLTNSTAIVPVLRALFASAEFAAGAGAKMLRPAEDLIASVRTLGIDPDPTDVQSSGIGLLYWLTSGMGNAPLGWEPPNGYPDVAPAWSGAGMTLARWNAHLALTGHWSMPGLRFPALPAYLLGTSPPTTRGALIDALIARLLPGHTVIPAHRAALVAFLGPDGPVRNGDLGWLFGPLVAMVLNSPYGSVR